MSTGDRFGVSTGDWLGVVVTGDRFGVCLLVTGLECVYW